MNWPNGYKDKLQVHIAFRAMRLECSGNDPYGPMSFTIPIFGRSSSYLIE